MNHIIVPQDIREHSRQRAAKFRSILKISQPSEVEIGQIWATRAIFGLPDGRTVETQEPRLIIVLSGHGPLADATEEITAVPLSIKTSMATDMDLVIPLGESSLDFNFMVEVWNETPVLKGHLRNYLGRLSDAAVIALEAVHRSQTGEQKLPAIHVPWVGLPIRTKEDIRLAFQEEEVRAFSHLAQAAAAVLGLEESKQEARATEQTANKSHFILPRWTVGVPAVFGRISEYLHQGQFSREQPLVAYAAGAEEDETLLFFHKGEEGRFLFELVNSRRPPYRVYLKVLMLSDELRDRQCIVTVKTETGHLASEPTMLTAKCEIAVGEDPYFERNAVESIEVTVEQ